MCDILKEEFRTNRFGLSHTNRDDLISCRWNWHPSVYVIYRILVAAYVTGFFLSAVIIFTLDGATNIMVYLTMWTYLVLTLYFLLSAIVVVCYTCFGRGLRRNGHDSTMNISSKAQNEITESYNNISFVECDLKSETNRPNGFSNEQNNYVDNINGNESIVEDITPLMKICWILGNVVQVFAIVVTLVYFTALFPQIGYTNCIDINLHGANSFFVIIDTCLHARPVRLLHVIHPVIYGACYLIFSAIYWSFDHVNHVLYPGVLDWNYPGTTMIWVSGLTLVGIPLLQLAHFGAYRLKLHFCRRD